MTNGRLRRATAELLAATEQRDEAWQEIEHLFALEGQLEWPASVKHFRARVEQAEAALLAATAELAAMDDARHDALGYAEDFRAELLAANQRNEELTEALRGIDAAESERFMNNHGIDQTEDDTSLVQRIARAALLAADRG